MLLLSRVSLITFISLISAQKLVIKTSISLKGMTGKIFDLCRSLPMPSLDVWLAVFILIDDNAKSIKLLNH